MTCKTTCTSTEFKKAQCIPQHPRITSNCEPNNPISIQIEKSWQHLHIYCGTGVIWAGLYITAVKTLLSTVNSIYIQPVLHLDNVQSLDGNGTPHVV